MKKFFLVSVMALFGFTLLGSDIASKEPTQTLYYGGDILTMKGQKAHYAEAVLVKDIKIDGVVFNGKSKKCERAWENK